MTGIVVGIDGSDGSRRALDWALDEGAAHNLPVKVVYAWSWPVRDLFTGDPSVTAEARERMAVDLVESMLAQALRDWRDEVHVRASAVAIEGDPRVILAEMATGADQLVVGARGTTGALGRLILGSTASYVVHHGPCPVTVVPLLDGDR